MLDNLYDHVSGLSEHSIPRSQLLISFSTEIETSNHVFDTKYWSGTACTPLTLIRGPVRTSQTLLDPSSCDIRDAPQERTHRQTHRHTELRQAVFKDRFAVKNNREHFPLASPTAIIRQNASFRPFSVVTNPTGGWPI
jgi:hypothetical protein